MNIRKSEGLKVVWKTPIRIFAFIRGRRKEEEDDKKEAIKLNGRNELC